MLTNMIIVGKSKDLSREGSQKSMEFSNGDRLVSTAKECSRPRPERPPPPGGTPPEAGNTAKQDPPTTNFFDTLNWEEENAPLALDSDEESDDEFNIHSPVNSSQNPPISNKREDSMDDEFAAFTSGRTNVVTSGNQNSSVQVGAWHCG